MTSRTGSVTSCLWARWSVIGNSFSCGFQLLLSQQLQPGLTKSLLQMGVCSMPALTVAAYEPTSCP